MSNDDAGSLVVKLTAEIGTEMQVTVSLGLAELSYNYSDSEEWLKKADKALYQAKENGRNRSVLFSKIK